MAGRDSSSKRKSSKRKRDKISSKKKSRRKESKKRRRIYDSGTSDSDDDSFNSERSSSSTSKSDRRRMKSKNKKRRCDSSISSYSDYKSVSSDSDTLSRRKPRWSQVGLKDTKRKGRKRFSSPGDVDTQSVRKRKRSDRDHVVKPIKKPSNKKSRKYASSSSSSDSESCSTCQSSSSRSTTDGMRQRSKVLPDKEIERLKGSESHKSKKKLKVRTPSCSSFDRGSDPSVCVNNSDGALLVTNNSRRLRSVIAVVDQPHDEGEDRWEMDLHKEEIEYDQNDFPSPKSVDSNDGGSKMESGKYCDGMSDNRICVENVAGEEVTEMEKSRIDEGDKNGPGDIQSEGAHTNDSQEEKEVDVSVPDTALGGDDLEAILRQKALENLRKFKGRLQTGPRSTTVKTNNECDVHRLSAGTVDVVQDKSIKQISSSAQEMNQRSGRSLKREFSLTTEVKIPPDSEHVDKDIGMAKQSDKHPPDEAALIEFSKDDKCTSSYAVLTEPVSRIDVDPGSGAGGTNPCDASTIVPSSSVRPISGEQSVERGNEDKDGSQFKQKTMSVMRGGEMVQVSYKVYIPKKAPALARRQLRR